MIFHGVNQEFKPLYILLNTHSYCCEASLKEFHKPDDEPKFEY